MSAQHAGDWAAFTAAKSRHLERLAQQSVIHRLNELWGLPSSTFTDAGRRGDAKRCHSPGERFRGQAGPRQG